MLFFKIAYVYFRICLDVFMIRRSIFWDFTTSGLLKLVCFAACIKSYHKVDSRNTNEDELSTKHWLCCQHTGWLLSFQSRHNTITLYHSLLWSFSSLETSSCRPPPTHAHACLKRVIHIILYTLHATGLLVYRSCLKLKLMLPCSVSWIFFSLINEVTTKFQRCRCD